MASLREEGIADVYITAEEAQEDFWESLIIATHWHIADRRGAIWEEWRREYRWATGLPEFDFAASEAYVQIVRDGRITVNHRTVRHVEVPERLAAIEHLLDLADSSAVEGFRDAVNDKAQWLRVGVAIQGRRFVPITSKHMHTEVVVPTLLLLAQPELEGVDGLYRKAFDRVFAHDNSGAITSATSAVEEMLRYGLGEEGGELKSLLGKARSAEWTLPAVEQLAVKLQALRQESDAHAPGTDDKRVAMLAIHVAGSILLHLGETLVSRQGAAPQT